MAIYEHNNQNESLWSKGKYQVMIKTPRSDRPFGYCDGTTEDENTLIATAEREGLDQVRISRKHLKTGREIWTVEGDAEDADFSSDMEYEEF